VGIPVRLVPHFRELWQNARVARNVAQPEAAMGGGLPNQRQLLSPIGISRVNHEMKKLPSCYEGVTCVCICFPTLRLGLNAEVSVLFPLELSLETGKGDVALSSVWTRHKELRPLFSPPQMTPALYYKEVSVENHSI
jgi:hypothetical protein